MPLQQSRVRHADYTSEKIKKKKERKEENKFIRQTKELEEMCQRNR